ncbi:hypothetical protein PENSPDRAFT_637286 [Peniophora sp. CONT]|nr:hypothetical protein PENSPDRAFT_637286 [Peniophora sp. CONT]
MSDAVATSAPLSQGLGYGIILGFGLAFALALSAVTAVSRRMAHEHQDVDAYLTAKRSIKTGLLASAVVSSWCWAATILNSVRISYIYGLPGIWYFASGCTIQILAFAIIAIELKRRAPRCHTIMEVVRVRWGTTAHIIYLCFGMATQLLVAASLLLGASAAVTAITGVNTIAALYLIPLGVVLYTLAGGLKATFVADWIHTVVIYIILLTVMFKVVASSDAIGSPAKLYDMLTEAAKVNPCFGAFEGSYLTMASAEGLILAAVILVSGFASVWVDPSYGQKALAGTPEAVVAGYFWGGACWFVIPFALSGTCAFAAVVLQDTQYWSTPGGITTYISNNGLILPLTVEAIMGKGGAAAILLMVFMAVTSSSSAEYIALSSVLTYDVYKPYLNPTASDKQLLWMGHMFVIGFALVSSSFAVGLYYAELNMAWVLEFLGVVIGPAVIPIAGSLMSDKMTKTTAIYSPLFALAVSISAWLGVTVQQYGEISVETTFGNWPMFAGCVGGIFTPLLWHWASCLIFRSTPKYDWSRLMAMDALEPRDGDTIYPVDKVDDLGHFDLQALARASRRARWGSIVAAIVFLIIIPIPMYATNYIFPKAGFQAFVAVEFIWYVSSHVPLRTES